MNATNDIKVHPLTVYFYISNEFFKPNCDWYDIGYLSLMMVEVSYYVSFLLYFEYFIALA